VCGCYVYLVQADGTWEAGASGIFDSAFKNLLLQESFLDNGIMPLKIILLQAI
jgi:hypothetical protein